MRKGFIAGNWKMNKSSRAAETFLDVFLPLVKNPQDVDIIIAPPSTLLSFLKSRVRGTKLKLAAQNIYFEHKGAFTGEISAEMAKEFADYVIIGHSERRAYFHEDNKMLNKKIMAALSSQLKVIYCVGETLEERENKNTEKVIASQINEGLSDITSVKDIVIAYEPVWAIGTGKTATPDQAEEVHRFIRKIIKSRGDTRIIYGGSVNEENAAGILKMPDIDGCLPGGASLNPMKFYKIIKSFP